ncbi:MAG: hypothetical protein JOZ38_11965 [Candidatus Eremiobacteraeota bacterium]|nr:hypothetical protein [Candidatus Eremiobacteraeota bacterium]
MQYMVVYSPIDVADEADSSRFSTAMKQFPWARLGPRVWIINTELETLQLLNYLGKYISTGDELFASTVELRPPDATPILFGEFIFADLKLEPSLN